MVGVNLGLLIKARVSSRTLTYAFALLLIGVAVYLAAS